VWLAHDPRLQRDVALKLMAAGADAGAVSEWMQEAHAVSRLKHPNIVPVFEADDAPDSLTWCSSMSKAAPCRT
jgi:serine/threonine protein kinase